MKIKNIMVVDNNLDITGFIKQSLEYIYPLDYKVICAKRKAGRNVLNCYKTRVIFQMLFYWTL